MYDFIDCIQNPIDLVILLDGSGSVGPTRFGLFKIFVQKLILRLNVVEKGTRVALVQFSDRKETKFEFGITNYTDIGTMLNAIQNIKYQYGRLQKTEIALKLAETKVRSDFHKLFRKNLWPTHTLRKFENTGDVVSGKLYVFLCFMEGNTMIPFKLCFLQLGELCFQYCGNLGTY